MRNLALLVLVYLSLSFYCFGQELPARGRTCATEAYQEHITQANPVIKQLRQEKEMALKQILQQEQQQLLDKATIITIPVVFHIVYNTAAENISDEQVLSQLAVLNADFRRTNADTANTPSYFQPYAADTGIEFCLATIDPNGDSTTGITRTQTSATSFSYISNYVKYKEKGGVDNWNPDHYLNIWICNIENNILGYASLPGYPTDQDGVVLHYTSVGAAPANRFATDYNLGRTATHEIGHWLGLKHIWGFGSSCADSDGVDDTPNQLGQSLECPEGIVSSCDNGPYGNMYQNYMDYTSDGCMNLFTKGQAAYMKAVLNSSRPALFNSLACSGTLQSRFTTAITNDTLTLAGNTVAFADTSEGARPTTWLWEFEGGIPATSTQQHPEVTYLSPGKYSVKLTISNGLTSSTEIKEDYMHVTVNDLVIYPNPTSDYITIEQPARILVHQVELVNHLGQTVIATEVNQRTLRLNVHHLPAGIYFLRLTSTNGTEIKKITVVH